MVNPPNLSFSRPISFCPPIKPELRSLKSRYPNTFRRERQRPILEFIQLAREITPADHRPDRTPRDDTGPDAVLLQRPDRADMGEAAGEAGPEGKPHAGDERQVFGGWRCGVVHDYSFMAGTYRNAAETVGENLGKLAISLIKLYHNPMLISTRKPLQTLDSSSWSIISRLAGNYVRPYRKRLAGAMFFMALSAAMTAAFAKLIEPVLDKVLVPGHEHLILPTALTVLAVFIVNAWRRTCIPCCSTRWARRSSRISNTICFPISCRSTCRFFRKIPVGNSPPA